MDQRGGEIDRSHFDEKPKESLLRKCVGTCKKKLKMTTGNETFSINCKKLGGSNEVQQALGTPHFLGSSLSAHSVFDYAQAHGFLIHLLSGEQHHWDLES